jgi:hypothetical protein
MPRWPANQENAECVYRLNEIYPEAGRYPVGRNGCWHSGIHINATKSGEDLPVYPIISGQLAACRISKDYKLIPRLKIISSRQYDKLQWYEQPLYVKDTKSGNYKLKETFTDNERKYIYEKYANSYILLRHTVPLSRQENSSIVFFTLYTNIRPYEHPEAEFISLDAMSQKVANNGIPFYQRFLFRLKQPDCSVPANGEKNLFPGSYCLIRLQADGTTYLARFANHGYEKKIPINLEEIAICGNPRYIPKDENVFVYDLSTKEKIARLKPGAYFKDSVKPVKPDGQDEQGDDVLFEVQIAKNPDDDIALYEEGQKALAPGAKVLVKSAELKIEEAAGHLKEKNSLFTATVKGLLKYNTVNGAENACGILTEGTEFHADSLLSQYKKGRQIIPVSSDKEETSNEYLKFEETNCNHADAIEVTVVYIRGYNSGGILPKRLNENELLGFSVQPPSEKTSCYDLILFFPDIAFLGNTRNTISAFVPRESAKLYTKRESLTCFFPTASEFNIIKKTSGAYYLCLKSMVIYLYKGNGKNRETLPKNVLDTSGKLVFDIAGVPGGGLFGAGYDSPAIKVFTQAFRPVQGSLDNTNTSYAGEYNDGQESCIRFRVDFTTLLKLCFWITLKEYESKQSRLKIENNCLKILTGGCALDFYTADPSTGDIFSETSRPLPKDYALKGESLPEGSTDDKTGKEYIAVNKNGFIAKTDFEKVNLLEWERFFDKLDTENDEEVFFGAFRPVGDFLFGSKDRAKDIYYDNDTVWNRYHKEPGRAASPKLAATRQNTLNKQKRRVICRHPLEWDETLYFDGNTLRDSAGTHFGIINDPGREKHFKDIVTAIDIWKDLKDAEIAGTGTDRLKENSFWFAHPVYFINHLDMMGAFEFNPYFGEHESLKEEPFTCRDNPGFAPPISPDDPESTKFEYAGEFYAEITGLFNADYLEANPTRAAEGWGYYWHEGVDFAGGKYGGKPIKSFIHGKLVKSGISAGGMGGYVVVRDNNNPNLFYVLVHLAAYEPEGLDIFPGTVVGTVGKDARSQAGFHLHLSHVIANTLEEVVKNNYFPFWKKDVKEGSSDSKRVLNPFAHNDYWKGRGHPRNVVEQDA